MQSSFEKLIRGYQRFREKYANGDDVTLQTLAAEGQQPEFMLVSCCDSRVGPALIFQCDPGELFITRNVANIVPPYNNDKGQHGTSAALEFGICYLHVKHLIIMGHSQCGGIDALVNHEALTQNDFIEQWISNIKIDTTHTHDTDEVAKQALIHSYHNSLSYPWIKKRVEQGDLNIQLWFFDIQQAVVEMYDQDTQQFIQLAA